MIIKPLNQNIEYIPESDRSLPEEEQTKFILRKPTLPERELQEKGGRIESIGDIEDIEGRKITIISGRTAQKMNALVKACMVRIENLKDSKGNIIEWKSGYKKDDILASISEIIPEIYNKLLESCIISEEQEKN